MEEDNNKNINIKMDGVVEALSSVSEIAEKFNIDKISHTIDDVSKITAKVFDDNFLETIDIINNNVSSMIKQLSFPEITDDMKYTWKTCSYLMALKDYKWPLYSLNDSDFIDVILDFSEKEVFQNVMDETIISILTNDYIQNLNFKFNHQDESKNWSPILDEIIISYLQGLYFSSTTLSMCTISGIINDLFEKYDDYLEKSRENLNILADFLELSNNDLNSKNKDEKRKLALIVNDIDMGYFRWQNALYYIFKDVYTSKNKNYDPNQPCRNMICHGIQTNYGTKEHALKAILCIDIVIWLDNYMYNKYMIGGIDNGQ
ncbi:MAG: hypothetical protein LUG60_01520 [Erysipelotrichaceae bacterium]|nr:hypothetical protein [Erysipelotrichaceae bacterium]